MKKFIQRHASRIHGTLSGFDRMRFRGTFRLLSNVRGMMYFLQRKQVKLTEFSSYAEQVTADLRDRVKQGADIDGRPVIHLDSPFTNKEELVQNIIKDQGTANGLVCVLSCVESCRSFKIFYDHNKHIDLACRHCKCLHFYHYFFDPYFGLVHVRTQTWFPFDVHICLNGREWLARQLDLHRMGYVRQDNCFLQIDDLPRAQQMITDQLRTRWSTHLDRLTKHTSSLTQPLFGDLPKPWPQRYWSLEESEWATDVMFKSPEELQALYPRFVLFAQQTFDSSSVMRYLGRKLDGRFRGEIVSYRCQRREGICIKHKVDHNSIKMYDKFAQVLRVETTINRPRDMKVFRRKEGDPHGPKKWRILRKGVADISRRAHLCQTANERYLDALEKVDDTTPIGDLLDLLSQPVLDKNGKRVRGLQPLTDDANLLAAISRGEFNLTGFRNRDLRPLLLGSEQVSDEQRRRQSAAVTRKLRLLRAHHLIYRVQKSHRYMLTELGKRLAAAITAIRVITTAQITQAA